MGRVSVSGTACAARNTARRVRSWEASGEWNGRAHPGVLAGVHPVAAAVTAAVAVVTCSRRAVRYAPHCGCVARAGGIGASHGNGPGSCPAGRRWVGSRRQSSTAARSCAVAVSRAVAAVVSRWAGSAPVRVCQARWARRVGQAGWSVRVRPVRAVALCLFLFHFPLLFLLFFFFFLFFFFLFSLLFSLLFSSLSFLFSLFFLFFFFLFSLSFFFCYHFACASRWGRLLRLRRDSLSRRFFRAGSRPLRFCGLHRRLPRRVRGRADLHRAERAGCPIAPSTFYAAAHHEPSRRDQRDAELIALIAAERKKNRFVARLVARKMWLHLRRAGHDVARCTRSG